MTECEICKSKIINLKFRLNNATFYKCHDCKVIWKAPRAELEETEKYYKEKYSSIFEGEAFGGHRNPFYFKALKEINRKRKGRMLLDVGCGSGQFLKLAKSHGWKACGVELSQEACKFLKDEGEVKVLYGNLFEARFQKDSFDVITLWNVLDHLYYPKKTLSEVYNILKINGLVGIRIPNALYQTKANSIYIKFQSLFRLMKIKSISVFHEFAFTPRAIKNFLKMAGFKDIEIKNSPLTKGDPYLYTKYSRIVSLGKFFVYGFCQLIYFLSIRNLIIGPSMLIWAYKR